MGVINGQDSNSLLSKRLKKTTSERPIVGKKHDQSSSVVAKIERVLFTYRETLAYYQEFLEKYEAEFTCNTRDTVSETSAFAGSNELQRLTDRLTACVEELEQKLQTIETAETAASKEDFDAVVYVDETLKEGLHRDNQDDVEKADTTKEEESLIDLEAYNNNLTEIRKRLDDLIKFVAKVDGSIIEALKAHTNDNQEQMMQQLMELKSLTKSRSKGVKPLLVFNLIFGIINVGGIVVLILNLMGIIQF